MTSLRGMPPNSDRDLVAAAAKGQAAAFASLIGRYRDVHTRYAIRMLGGYEPADEALQTAFVRGFQALARTKLPDQFSDWLFRIVINECRARALRRAVREGRMTGETPIVSANSLPPKSDAAAEAQHALNQIDPINREAFILQYIEELTYPQIAALTGASVITLERQVDRACARLRELLPQWHKDHREAMARPADGAGDVGPSFPVRVASPLRRAEVLNDSFEDRLMAKLLRPVEGLDGAAKAEPSTAPIPATQKASAASVPNVKQHAAPAPLPLSTMLSQRRPSFAQIAGMGVGAALIALAFAAGDAMRGRSDAKSRAGRGAKTTAAAPRVVRRSDTVRVTHNDTILFARFALADEGAHAVAVIGDFNHWDAGATPLARVGAGAWATTVRLRPGRYEYAFLVDGKRWVTDRFARTMHDEFDTPSSVIATTPLTTSFGPAADGSGSSRIKKALPHATAERVASTIATAKSDGLPAAALENRALKFEAKHVTAKDIEHAIAGEAARMRRAHELLVAADRREPSDGEIIAAADLLRRDTDTSAIATLARSVPANRALEVPFRVSGQLIAAEMPAHDAIARVEDRLRSGVTDSQLEHLLDEPATRVASKKDTKGKESRVAKSTSGASVRQAGAPAKTTHTTKPRHKSSGTQ